MKEEHILDILDKQRFDELSRTEKDVIETHAAECSKCAIAYKSAQISSVLLKTSVMQNFEPTPFFHTRVLANLREKEIVKTPFFAFTRLWRASGSLVAVMITTVFVLLATTIFAPDYKASANDLDTAEIVILDGKSPNREFTNEQFLQMINSAERKEK